jgi:hypothetical protein
MKNIVAAAFLAILAAATFALVYAYAHSVRFQLVPTNVYDNALQKEEPQVFLIDTLTGRVWEYSPPLFSNGRSYPDNFASVPVAGLHGAELMRHLRLELEDLKEGQALKNSKEYQEYQELQKAKAASH